MNEKEDKKLQNESEEKKTLSEDELKDVNGGRFQTGAEMKELM